jgi:uncharacterized protein (DUF488 family)
MKIYTGNFANAKKYREAGLETISIARFNRYYTGRKYEKLAPPAEIIHIPEKEYVPLYKDMVLSRLKATEAIKDLRVLAEGRDVILLCYEKAGDFCHRRLVADWIEKETGQEVVEFQTKIPQQKLF